MKLTLKRLTSRGTPMLSATELEGDENFVAFRNCRFDCPDSQRWSFDEAVVDAAVELGFKPFLFNQERWVGESGWEFFKDDWAVITQLADKVSAALGVPYTVVGMEV